VHMYPYLARDRKGGLLVASSDGVADSHGHLLWMLKAEGFTRLVPLRRSNAGPVFLAYHSQQRIDLHTDEGEVLWSVNLGVSDIGTYITPEGRRLPFAKTGVAVNVYDLDGKLQSKIPLPAWAFNVAAVAWPKPGHLLAGRASRIGVIDSDGKEVLAYTIRDTSFDPYHGPDGTAVRFDASKEPYLAVTSHGSSGYPRSVLLIFDPEGHLVWQEEIKKIGAMLAIPAADSKREVLLVGGIDGILEYSFPLGKAR
jgi:outer membrane protein assembly factor BamB